MTVPDAERERVIALLREQAGEGRLDLDEFGARLDEAYQATTVDGLRHALRELPVTLDEPRRTTGAGPAAQPSQPAQPARGPGGHHHHNRPPRPPMSPAKAEAAARAAWGGHLGAYLSVNAMLIVIWALTTPGGYFWPMWPLMGWGIGLVSHGMAHRAAMRARERQRGRELPQ